MLNLDQMVAKFHGEEIPPEDDPFAPMKRALEEEERKSLLEKGVSLDEGVPLVLSPEATLVSEEIEAPVVEEVPSAESAPVKTPVVQEDTPDLLAVQPYQQLPEEAPALDPAMFSLDDIIPEDVMPVSTTKEVTTKFKLPNFQNKNVLYF